MRKRCRLQSQSFAHPAQQTALQEMVLAERHAGERVDCLTASIESVVADWSLSPAVEALQSLRGVALIGAVTFMAEISDVRRFDHPRKLMAYLGLVLSEYSTGLTIRRGGITKAGDARVRRALVEGGRIQVSSAPFDLRTASSSAMASSGVFQLKVLRGRWFISRATSPKTGLADPAEVDALG